MMGLKLANADYGPIMTQLGFRAGLLTIFANHDPSVIQILPPLIIQPGEVEQVLNILDEMLGMLEMMV